MAFGWRKGRWSDGVTKPTAAHPPPQTNISSHRTLSSPLQQLVEEDQVGVQRHARQRPLALRHRLLAALMDAILQETTTHESLDRVILK